AEEVREPKIKFWTLTSQAQMEQLLLKKSYSHIINATLHKRVPLLSGMEYTSKYKYLIKIGDE
ncbi:hypothetical protein, partial [Clostridium beijerinckii]